MPTSAFQKAAAAVEQAVEKPPVDSDRFLDAVCQFLHVLEKHPQGVETLVELSQFVSIQTAKGTPYAIAFAEGIAAVKCLPPDTANVDITEVTFTYKPDRVAAGETNHPVPGPRDRLRAIDCQKRWCRELKEEVTLLGVVLRSPGLPDEAVVEALKGWKKAAEKLRRDGDDQFVDGCKILADMQEDDTGSWGTTLAGPSDREPMFVKDVAGAVGVLAKRLVETDDQPVGKHPSSRETTAEAANDRKDEPPKDYLFGWADVAKAVSQKNDEPFRKRVKKLHVEYPSPLIFGGAGKPPTAVKDEFVQWWNELEEHFRTAAERQRDKDATVAETYQHGRDETVVPGVQGHVKHRRGQK